MILLFKRVDPKVMGPRDPYKKDSKSYSSSFIVPNVNPQNVHTIGRSDFWDTTSPDVMNVMHISRNWLNLMTTGNSRFLSKLKIRREREKLCCVIIDSESKKLVPDDSWLEVSMPCNLLIPIHPSVQNSGTSTKACSRKETRYINYAIELMTTTAYNSIKTPHNIKLYNGKKIPHDIGFHDSNDRVIRSKTKPDTRSRQARLSETEQLRLYKSQRGLCALCKEKLKQKWEANHSEPHALREVNTKPDQLLCTTCHSLKSAIEWHKSRRRNGESLRASLAFPEFKLYKRKINEAHEMYENEDQQHDLRELIRRGNWRPNKNISHRKLANYVANMYPRGRQKHHPVQNPQRLPVLEQYNIFPESTTPLKLYENVRISKFIPYFMTEPGTRFYAGNTGFAFSKNGKQVTMSAKGVGDVAIFDFDGRRGEINRVEWVGDGKVNVYVKYLRRS